MNLISSMGSYVVGIVVAIIVIFVIAVVNVRAVFPTDFIEIRIPTRPAYNPNANAGFQQVNAQAPNMAYGQGAGYQHVNAQAPNAAYGQNAGYQQYAPNAQAQNPAYGQNPDYNQNNRV